MLGTRLKTKQTGPEGLPVERVYVESGSEIEREIYVSLTLNREKGRIALIASAAGGMDIEEVAEKTPEQILTATIHPSAGLQPYQARQIAFGLGLEGPADRGIPGDRHGVVQALHGAGRQPRRGESPHRDQGGQARRARCQDQHRCQRCIPPS